MVIKPSPWLLTIGLVAAIPIALVCSVVVNGVLRTEAYGPVFFLGEVIAIFTRNEPYLEQGEPSESPALDRDSVGAEVALAIREHRFHLLRRSRDAALHGGPSRAAVPCEADASDGHGYSANLRPRGE